MSADFTHGTQGEEEFLLDTASMVFDDTLSPEGQQTEAPADGHATGRQLRHRLITAESIAELEATGKPSLLQRLLRRK